MARPMPLFPPVMRAFLPASFMISSWTAGPLTTTTVINGIWRVPNFASSKQESWEDRSSPVAVAEIWPSVVSDQAAKFAVLDRRDRKPARTSSVKSCGCSQAAKWPPLGSLL